MNPEPFRGLPAGSELMVAFSGGSRFLRCGASLQTGRLPCTRRHDVHARKRAFQPGKSRSGGGTS